MSDANPVPLTRVAVRAQVLGCERCGLRSLCTRPVPFSGDNPSPLVVVGEAPGKEEDARGRPFVGAAGALLRKVMDTAMGSESGASRFTDTLAYVNVVSCYPNRTPHQSEVVACRENLTAQLRLLEPWYGLVVGGVAVSSFWPGIRIGDMRGRWWYEDRYREQGKRTWFMATWHPSAVLRSGGLTSQVGREFQADVIAWSEIIQDHKRPGLTVECVKCGRGDRQGKAEVWERNLGACTKHRSAIEENVSSAPGKRSSASRQTARTTAKGSAAGPRTRGASATPGKLW